MGPCCCARYLRRFLILRQEDGSLWVRVNGLRTYRIENLERLQCHG